MEKHHKDNNRMGLAWRILAGAFCIVILFPVVQKNIPFLAEQARPYSVFGLFDVSGEDQGAILQDSSILADTIMTMQVDSADLEEVVTKPRLQAPDIDTPENVPPDDSALRALKAGTQNRLRILWFGSSMIEGDLITQDVRDALQRQFGGSGVGYVPLTSPIYGFRESIWHRFSDNWERYHVISKKMKPRFPINWNGEYFTAPRDTTEHIQTHRLLTVTYKRMSKYPGIRVLPNPVLLYGPRRKDPNVLDAPNYVIIGQDTLPLQGQQILNAQQLVRRDLKTLELKFLLKPDQPIYGVSFQSDTGVIVDNFALRGNSGLALVKVPKEIFRAYAELMGADLVILQYGVNAMALGYTQYGWYERSMVRVVAYLKQAMPDAAFIIISTADRASKQNGIMQTDSAVYSMNRVLRRVADRTGCAYFNLFEAMGGTGSMVEWVEASPSLANNDYTHFNARGSRKVAGLFLQFLLSEIKKMEKDEEGIDDVD